MSINLLNSLFDATYLSPTQLEIFSFNLSFKALSTQLGSILLRIMEIAITAFRVKSLLKEE